MPLRWFICPMDESHVGDHHGRWPRISRMVDPGTGLAYGCAATASSGLRGEDNSWALCLVSGQDFAPLYADQQIQDVLGEEYYAEDGLLDEPPEKRGWSQQRLSGLRGLLSKKGAAHHVLSERDPLWRWLQRLGQRLSPAYDPRKVKAP
jgi:hypothetical protein